jgi:outer membrane lipoprotein-sorting protein
MLMVITQPRLMKGQAILRRSDDMWLYLPRSRTVTRIGAKEQSLGGEASNADLLRTELGRDYQVNLVGMEDVDGEECYHLRLKALKRSLAYDQVDYWIAREAGLPVKREYYSLSGKLLRTITFADRREFGGRLIPARTTITNQLNPGYATTITLVKTRENSPIPDARFTTAWLESGASLSE